MGSDENLKGGSVYLVLYPERRKESRKNPKGGISDQAKLRKNPRKKPQSEIHARVWTVLDSDCEVLDLSCSGLRIRTKVSLPKGEEVGLHLLVPKTKDSIKQSAIFPTCQIVWIKSENDDAKSPYHMGLKIVQMTEKQKEMWRSFVDGLPELTLEPS